MLTQFRNVRLVMPDRISEGQLLVGDGKIAQVLGADAALISGAECIDGGGCYLSPGFVELHTHGAGGHDFMDGEAEGFEIAAKTHLRHGTTSLLPTTVAATGETIKRCIDAFRETKSTMRDGPDLLGLHLEGPYLNMEWKGAIDPRYIRDPDPAEYRSLVEYASGCVRRWTVAPECAGALEMGDYLVQNGILPSMGHTGAEISQVREAVHHGYTHITHLYSCTSTIVRRSGFRYPGVTESAYILDGVTSEVIADGCHLPVELLEMVYRFIGPDRVCLTCDSIRCAGTGVTDARIGDRKNGLEIIIEDGVAKLPDRSAFAGSIATDDQLVRVMHRDVGIPLYESVRMMTLTPATIIGEERRKGSIAAGKDADLILFDGGIHVSLAMVGGKVVWREKEETAR